MATPSPTHIGIVVGEASGDILGANLMAALKEQHPNLKFTGIGGPNMLAQGFESLYPQERLAVMGIIDPLKRLPELLRIRKHLYQHFLDTQPDIVVGIDSPDFNLTLELRLREQGLKTAHYVSPSVWAWRRGRVKKIAKAVDLMLTLFPFEAQFYVDHNVPVKFVGHPLADTIPVDDQQDTARKALGIASDAKLVALLPGSRGSEVGQLAQPFLETSQWLFKKQPELRFILPAASTDRRTQIQPMIDALPEGFPLTVLDGQSQLAMKAADVVLMASGTTTLEALFCRRPMVVCYKFGWLQYAIFSRLMKAPFFSLPNLLANRALVPELVQADVRADVIGPLLLERLENDDLRHATQREFDVIHKQLALNASQESAHALLDVIGQGG